MAITPPSLPANYWETFQVLNSDIEYLSNRLLELETPQTSHELAKAIIEERIRKEKQGLENQQQPGGAVYLPKGTYEVGQTLVFPALIGKKQA